MQEKFQQLSPADFFYSNRDMAGFGTKPKAMYTSIREMFENALDACDGAKILPDISITIEAENDEKSDPKQYKLTVIDNGPGMAPKRLPEAFGTVLYGSKFGLRQARGVFGMGVTMTVLYGQITCAKPATVASGVGKEWTEYMISLDIQKNKPRILNKTTYKRKNSGLLVSVIMEGDYRHAASKIRAYIRKSALITPYATIRYQGPRLDNAEDTINIERVTDKMPNPPEYTIPHPYGSDAEGIKRMIDNTFKLPPKLTAENLKAAGITQDDPKKFPKKFKSSESKIIGAVAHSISLGAKELVNCIPYYFDFSGVLYWQDSIGRDHESKITKEMCKLVGMEGEKLSKFLTHFQGVGPGIAKRFCKEMDLDPNARILLMKDDPDIIKIMSALNRYDGFRPPDSSCLAPLGSDLLKAGMETMFKPEFIETIQRPAKSYSGFPFVVELGLAYGGEIPADLDIHRFANRIPLLYDEGSDAAVLVIKNIDWRRYGIRDDSPLAICSHICSTKIPYDNAGKEKVASREEIDKEIKLALLELGRKLSLFIKRRDAKEKESQRASALEKYLKLLAENTCKLIGAKVPPLGDVS